MEYVKYRLMVHFVMFAMTIVTFNQPFLTAAGGGELQIITKSQTLRLGGGSNVLLPCEFLISRFDIFDNPVIWRKIQMDEDVEININSVMLEPFQDTHRFDATSSVDGNVRKFNLKISNVSIEDTGNYTCDVHGPQNALLGSVSHLIYVKAPLSTLIINSVDDEAIISSLPPFSKSSSLSFQEHHQTMKLDHHYQHYKDEDIGAFESKNEADGSNGYYYDDDGVDDAGRSSNSFHNYSKNKFTNVAHSNKISTLTQRQVAQTFSPPRPQSLTVHSTSPPNHYDSHPSLVGVMESLESLEQEIQRLYVKKNGKEESGSHYIVEDVDSILLNKTGNNYFSSEHVHRNLNNKINSNYTQSKYNSLVGTPASHIGRNVTYVAGRASRLSCIASGFYPPVTLSVLVAQMNISNDMKFHQRMWLGEGVKGFRPIHFESIRWMDNFKPTADNDGSEVACVATLSTSSASTSNNYTFLHLLVNYAPIVSCSALHAQLNQAEAVLTCSIRAQPGVVSILWHYPNNQQGNATRHQQHHQQQKYLGADENSMQNRVTAGGTLETSLIMKPVQEKHFGVYNVTADNGFAVGWGNVELKKKLKPTQRTWSLTEHSSNQALKRGVGLQHQTKSGFSKGTTYLSISLLVNLTHCCYFVTVLTHVLFTVINL